ncbi:MAG: DNA-directed RNA polymerase subunit L [Theionarchaea archaeon]|nr:DNA-directed RNA polymerase subunit L [Theionarchaea archaeon]
MELKVVQKEDNKLEVILEGEDHTFANLLRRILREDEHVTYAAYKVDHPLLDRTRPVIFVETDGKETPKEALIEAARKIKEQINEFGERL